MAKNLAGKKIKAPKRPSKEKIHGVTVDIGEGKGKRIGRKAKSAIELRRERQRKMLESMD
jgi:hypothetical protein